MCDSPLPKIFGGVDLAPSSSWGNGKPPTPGPAAQVLAMIEQRIKHEADAHVKQVENDLHAIINIELAKLGINPDTTNTYSYVMGIAALYREQLVAKHVVALVDSLITPAAQ